jgi:ribosomal protein S18 acetylase RimI-like enzyme
LIKHVAIELSRPGADRLGGIVGALRDWQQDTSPMQVHPGDLGWYWRFGAAPMAAALRTWSRDGELLAIGFLDGPGVLRMTVAPHLWHDDALARQVVADVSEPERGVLAAGEASVEAPDGTRVQELLAEAGWEAGEPWTPLRRDLTGPADQAALRIDVVARGHEAEFIAVHRSAWGSSRFTAELWRAMSTGLPYTDARCLLGHDDHGVAVAGVTVWSAGAGKPGLLEPMGVHADHRGRGYGAAICVAAAAELKSMGSSSAMVCTPSANTAAVATYRSAGYQPMPERLDRTRRA